MEPKNEITLVILNLIQDLQRLPLQLVNNLRGRYPAGRSIKYGMTSLYNNGNNTYAGDPRQNSSGMTTLLTTACSLPRLRGKVAEGRMRGHLNGFTLIELLVVVLIIGILAAIAVPQYKKAVIKSQLTQALVIFDAYRKGIDLWVLANGLPTSRILFTGDESTGMHAALDIDVPGTQEIINAANTISGFTIYSEGTRWGGAFVEVAGADYDRLKPLLNGCTLVWCRFGSALENDWRFLGTAYKMIGGGNGDATLHEDCKEVAKQMCQYWKDQGLPFNSTAKAQCDSVGVPVEVRPYADEL